MRRLLTALALCLAPLPATAETLSAEIGRAGIAATAARLAALPERSAEEAFALAGLRFLGGVERALHLRWQTGIRADWTEIPVLRLPVPENPAARRVTGADVETLFVDLSADMAAARQALDAAGPGDFGLELRLADIWFDIDGNGARGEGEALFAVAGAAFGGARAFAMAPEDPVVRFDTADAEWLRAYTHLLSSLAETALAFDPVPAVDRVLADADAMGALWGTTPPANAMDMMFGRQVDRVTIILDALNTRPDKARAAAVRDHLLAMVAANRRFWALLAAETDNDREWVPNDNQTMALGLTVPQGTGERWLAVLSDAEAVIEGRLLVPYWRFGAEAGIDVSALLADPPALDPLGVIQGRTFLPYARKGPRIDGESWRQFERLVQGDAGLFAVFLN